VINHKAIVTALGDHLLDLSVCTTGSITVTVTSTAYTRASGSFVTDGFEPGMEVAGTGFNESENNSAKTILGVSALSLTCSGLTAEGAGSRTLSVGLPAGQAWENVHYEPTTGDPWIEENYLPGPMEQITLGSFGELEVFPTYVIKVYTPINVGMSAIRSYVDAILSHFAPRTELTVANHAVMVRTQPAPYSGQILRLDSGFVVCPVTVPLRVRTANTI